MNNCAIKYMPGVSPISSPGFLPSLPLFPYPNYRVENDLSVNECENLHRFTVHSFFSEGGTLSAAIPVCSCLFCTQLGDLHDDIGSHPQVLHVKGGGLLLHDYSSRFAVGGFSK